MNKQEQGIKIHQHPPAWPYAKAPVQFEHIQFKLTIHNSETDSRQDIYLITCSWDSLQVDKILLVWGYDPDCYQVDKPLVIFDHLAPEVRQALLCHLLIR